MSECLQLKKSNCKNCYKCIRYCPVKSIRFSGSQAHIVERECILCGKCFVVCPQEAREVVDETEKVKVLLQSGQPVVVSLAPSFIANYSGVGINKMREAVKKLGFFDVEETAVGATIVKRKYDQILVDKKHNVLISSCCHSVNLLIQKHFAGQLPHLAQVASPMQAHALDIKKRIPNAKVVFIGPCIAKKDEAEHYKDIVDAVLTFEELSDWLENENIELEQEMDQDVNSKARFFPTTGGIVKTMEKTAKDYTYMAIDGPNHCIAALKDIKDGKINNCFIEMSMCIGSCIGGPIMEKNKKSPIQNYISVSQYAGEKDFIVEDVEINKNMTCVPVNAEMPNELQIREIFKSMGKDNEEERLNCGSCGYDSCREKAIAVFQNKADITMCLPFLSGKAESFSDNIFTNTPNGILVLNEKLEIQQINKAALELMKIDDESYVKGENCVRILDPTNFLKVLEEEKNYSEQGLYLADYGKYVDQTILYDKAYRIIICIMRDITKEIKIKNKKEEASRQTADIADKVVQKQMKVVQEIALLLGETAAETKIALTKLKEVTVDE
ncbi:MAG: [Fe-Fe] hydrogenase large subunit C-terminal domain-containing protein [Lachnospirales bacterium]